MRGVLPWLVTVLVGAGAATAGVLGSLGLPGQSASAWVRQLSSTTLAAGTAHVRIAISIAGGTSPRRAGVVSVGVVDFRTDAIRLTTRSGPERSAAANPLVEIVIGHRTYLNVAPGGATGMWIESTVALEGTDARARALGMVGAPAAVWQVHDLGRSPVAGGTTRYRLTVRTVHPLCSSEVIPPPTLEAS